MPKKNKKKKKGVQTITLTPVERMNVIRLLPPKAKLGTMRLRNDLAELLSFSKVEETKIQKLRDPCPECGHAPKDPSWDSVGKVVKPRSFRFGGLEHKMIVERLQTLDEEDVIEPFHVPLWGKFIDGEG